MEAIGRPGEVDSLPGELRAQLALPGTVALSTGKDFVYSAEVGVGRRHIHLAIPVGMIEYVELFHTELQAEAFCELEVL